MVEADGKIDLGPQYAGVRVLTAMRIGEIRATVDMAASVLARPGSMRIMYWLGASGVQSLTRPVLGGSGRKNRTLDG